jgi:hypothetical protein
LRAFAESACLGSKLIGVVPDLSASGGWFATFEAAARNKPGALRWVASAPQCGYHAFKNHRNGHRP